MTALPTFTIKEMIDAGVHFGHKAMRWNPEMAPYIYATRDGVHIIDLQQTAGLLHRALQAVQDVAKRQGKILFVGTKRQASEHIKEAALRCGQFYVDKRWLGGTLTNWKTVSQSIKTLYELEKAIHGSESGEGVKLTKKEILDMARKCQKLENSLGGIRQMNGRPDIVFVIDTNKESLAVKEAQKLGIPIVAIIDSNSYPHGIDYIVPGNDDATRAIKLYCQLVSDAVLSGVEHSLISSGVDMSKAKESAKVVDIGDGEVVATELDLTFETVEKKPTSKTAKEKKAAAIVEVIAEMAAADAKPAKATKLVEQEEKKAPVVVKAKKAAVEVAEKPKKATATAKPKAAAKTEAKAEKKPATTKKKK